MLSLLRTVDSALRPISVAVGLNLAPGGEFQNTKTWDGEHKTNQHPPARQYAEFGRDVRGLAENLDILGRVVVKADQSLRQEGGAFKPLRWDRSSLEEIIGDYEETLKDCSRLLENNHRYRLGSGPLRNIEWNVLVAPAAERLRARIALHNSKVLHVLKPFEM